MLKNYAAASAGSGSDDPESVLPEIIEYFRDTNAEGLRLRERIADAAALGMTSDQAGFRRAFADISSILINEIGDARQRALAIGRWRTLDASWVARYARELTQVSNAWDDLEQLWNALDPATAPVAELFRIGKASLETLDQLVFVCACQTIPDELDEYLKNYRIGTSLDFLATFRDQLPTDEATLKVLAWLAPQSVVISGLVDLKHAKVIKADRRVGRQMLSVVAVVVAVLLGFGLIALSLYSGSWLGFSPDAWPIGRGEGHALSSAYVLVLLGVLAHWILDRVKLTRSGDDVTPFSEWLMWIHVNEVPIVTRIATVWLTIALGIGFHVYKLSGTIQPVTFFTAGYFLDSTFDALIGRFNTFVSSKDPAERG